MAQTNLLTAAAPVTAQLPHDLAAERAILHALLNGADLSPVLLESLRPDMFYTYAHNWLFAAMLDLHAAGSEIGVVTLLDRARARGELDVLRDGSNHGEQLIRWLKSADAAPDGSETLRGNAQIVKEKAARRIMKKRALELNALADDETKPASTQITQFAATLHDIKPFSLDEQFIPAGQAVSAHHDMLSAKAQYKSWALTPWQTFTDRGIILRDDALVCVIGPEGAGKSAFHGTWAEYSARNGVKTAYIFTEMSANDVLDRAAVRRDKRIKFSELLKPDQISDATWSILTNELDQPDPYDNNLMFWQAGAGTSEDKLLTAMSRLTDDYGVREFHIDGLNDVVPEQGRNENKTEAWRGMLMRLEAWCEAHHARVIFSTQMNKDGGSYAIGAAARQKPHICLEIKVEQTEFVVPYKYDGVDYKALPGQTHPIHTIMFHKVRHGPGSGPCELMYVGARYLWVDTYEVKRGDFAAYSAAADVGQRAQSEE